MIGPFDSLMLRTLLNPIIAAMQLFAAYVLLHGHYSPGGGFQAGILLAATLILPLLATGREAARFVVPARVALAWAAGGVFIFAGVGVLALGWSAPMLDYAALPLAGDVAERRSLGILLIEVGVTLAVAGAMVSIFYALAGRLGGEEPL